MTATGAAASIAGMTLLERAINYTLGSLHLVTPDALVRPTPCRGWNLRALLEHLDDSLLTLTEAVDAGHVALDCVDDPDAVEDVVATLRGRARHLLCASTVAQRYDLVSIADLPLTSGMVTGTGAIEVAVHGWDVARACGRSQPIPAALAEELLDLAPLLVTGAERPGRFDQPVAVPPGAGPGDRLVAFLGRAPGPDG
jgi:uncharacterized protein (TIGR03086 family)